MKKSLFFIAIYFCLTSLLFAASLFVPLDEIRPTQFVVGKAILDSKIEKVEEKFEENELEDYLKSKSADTIIGPDGDYYIVDRHHLASSVYYSKIPVKEKGLWLNVINDFQAKSYDEFYQYLKENNYVYLKVTGEGEKRIEDLPKYIKDLKDDPYRSLAWMIREIGGFLKVNIPFLEFFWAEFFFQNKVKVSKDKISHHDVEKALELAWSSLASHLPGHVGDDSKQKKCDKMIKEILQFASF